MLHQKIDPTMQKAMMMIRLTDSATLSAAGGFLANSLSLIPKLTKTVKKLYSW